MPLSAVVQLEAMEAAQLDQFSGRGVHGLWFNRWRDADADYGDSLHAQESPAFTLSPLMGLPRTTHKGTISFQAGQPAWFRVTTLSDELTEAVRSKWLAGLEIGSQVQVPEERTDGDRVIPGVRWKVSGVLQESSAHPFASQVAYDELSRRHLMQTNPPRQWKIEFLTPTTFHGKSTHLPFPLPESLINSWMRRWQAFAPIALPAEEMSEWMRNNLAVSAYSLRTQPAREGERLRVGCVGTLTLRALDMPPYLRAAVDLLAAYSFYCGSGSHTAQGLGQTRCISSSH